jgi:hypothetical protein
MPEPIPCSPAGPDLIPGPVNAQCLPPGPPDCLSLPNDNLGAFPCEAPSPECACFFHVGMQALQHDHFGRGAIAVLDPQNLDTGNPPPPGARVLQSFDHLHQTMNFGVRATAGYLWENQAVEFTGFYVFNNTTKTKTTRPGRIDSFFIHPPLGFEGDNGIFLQDDRLHTTFQSAVGDAELNYRWSSPAVREAEWFLGVRYFDSNDRIASTFDDDGLAFPLITGGPDPLRVATYAVTSHNRLVAPQLGFEYGIPVCSWLTLGVTAKGAWGVNFVEVERDLVRGDGFSGLHDRTEHTMFSQLYEINPTVDFHLLERARLRLGYSAMWLLQASTVTQDYRFDLSNQRGTGKNGSIFWHGPQAELQFLF